jgi:ATP-dependent Clp protease protease subunit
MKKLLAIVLMFMSLSALSYETINLNKNNSVVLNEAVRSSSVAKVQSKIFELAGNLDADKPIYLILDTPGGSIIAGRNLVDSLMGIENPIHTITIFAASMGYQIAQNLGTRYILPSGILMSHRAYISGLRGQVPGEANTNLEFIQSLVVDMEETASKRVGIPLKDYQNLIRDEYWVFGKSAVKSKHADKVTFAKCSKSLLTTRIERVNTFFGAYDVKFSNCPLIRGMLGYERVKGYGTPAHIVMQGDRYIQMMFNNKKEFFETHIKGKETF